MTTVAESANGVSSLAVSYKNEKENENMNAFYHEIETNRDFVIKLYELIKTS